MENCRVTINYLDSIHSHICSEDPALDTLSKLWDKWRIRRRFKGQVIQRLVNVCDMGRAYSDTVFSFFIAEIKLPNGQEFDKEHINVFTKGLHKYFYRFLWFAGQTDSRHFFNKSFQALEEKIKCLDHRAEERSNFYALEDLEIELWNSKVFGIHSKDSFTDTICYYIVKIFGFSSYKALSCLKTNHFNFGRDRNGQYVEITREFEKAFMHQNASNNEVDAMDWMSYGIALDINGEKKFRHYTYEYKSHQRTFYSLISYYIKVLNKIGINHMFVHSVQSKELIFPSLKFDNAGIIVQEGKFVPKTQSNKINVTKRIIKNINARSTVYDISDIRLMVLSKLSKLGLLKDTKTGYSIEERLKIHKLLDFPTAKDLEMGRLGHDLTENTNGNERMPSHSVVPYYLEANFSTGKTKPVNPVSIKVNPSMYKNMTEKHLKSHVNQPTLIVHIGKDNQQVSRVKLDHFNANKASPQIQCHRCIPKAWLEENTVTNHTCTQKNDEVVNPGDPFPLYLTKNCSTNNVGKETSANTSSIEFQLKFTDLKSNEPKQMISIAPAKRKFEEENPTSEMPIKHKNKNSTYDDSIIQEPSYKTFGEQHKAYNNTGTSEVPPANRSLTDINKQVTLGQSKQTVIKVEPFDLNEKQSLLDTQGALIGSEAQHSQTSTTLNKEPENFEALKEQKAIKVEPQDWKEKHSTNDIKEVVPICQEEHSQNSNIVEGMDVLPKQQEELVTKVELDFCQEEHSQNSNIVEGMDVLPKQQAEIVTKVEPDFCQAEHSHNSNKIEIPESTGKHRTCRDQGTGVS